MTILAVLVKKMLKTTRKAEKEPLGQKYIVANPFPVLNIPILRFKTKKQTNKKCCSVCFLLLGSVILYIPWILVNKHMCL